MATAMMAGYAARSAVGQAQAKTNAIEWEKLNWPSSCDALSLLHLDINELAEKRTPEAASTLKVLYRWWIFLEVILFLNMLDSIIVAGAADDSAIYPGVNVLYSFFNVVIGSVLGVFVWYSIYVFLADATPSAKWKGLGTLFVMMILIIVQMSAAFGNVHGFSNMSSDRMVAAEAKDLGVVGFWKAVTVIESLLWLVNLGWAGFGAFKSFRS